MSALAEPALDAATGDRLARRNAVVLSVAQALAGGNNTVLIATAGIVGTMLAPDKGLATLPISVFVFGMWISTLPMGWLARNLGRRTALQIGTVSGILTGLICCVAVLQGSFLLFNIGAIFSGFYAAAHQSYRFAAADTASDAFKAKAISWVLVGGVFGAVVGPQLVIATKDLWQPYLFAASYIAQSAVRAGRRRRADVPENSAPAAANGDERGPAVVRNRPAAALPRRGRLRRRQLFDDEPGDDVGAARHGHVQPFDHRCHARPAVAHPRHVRAELRDRQR